MSSNQKTFAMNETETPGNGPAKGIAPTGGKGPARTQTAPSPALLNFVITLACARISPSSRLMRAVRD